MLASLDMIPQDELERVRKQHRLGDETMMSSSLSVSLSLEFLTSSDRKRTASQADGDDEEGVQGLPVQSISGSTDRRERLF